MLTEAAGEAAFYELPPDGPEGTGSRGGGASHQEASVTSRDGECQRCPNWAGAEGRTRGQMPTSR